MHLCDELVSHIFSNPRAWSPCFPYPQLSILFSQRLFPSPSPVPVSPFPALQKGAVSALPKIITAGFKAIHLIYFFTCGVDEVKCWQIRKGTKAPQAAGTIHTDFEKGFICAEVGAETIDSVYDGHRFLRIRRRMYQELVTFGALRAGRETSSSLKLSSFGGQIPSKTSPCMPQMLSKSLRVWHQMTKEMAFSLASHLRFGQESRQCPFWAKKELSMQKVPRA